MNYEEFKPNIYFPENTHGDLYFFLAKLLPRVSLLCGLVSLFVQFLEFIPVK